MAGFKIINAPDGQKTTLAGTEIWPMADGSLDKYATVDAISDYIVTDNRMQPNLKFLGYFNTSVVSITTGQISSAPQVLAKWQITRIVADGFLNSIIGDFMSQGIGKVDSGAGTVTFAIQRSDDDSTWTNLDSTEFTTGSYVAEHTRINGFDLTVGTQYIRVCAYNSDGATTGSIKQISSGVPLSMPVGYTVTTLV